MAWRRFGTSSKVNGREGSMRFAVAREKMVREQLIARGIKDERVLEAMRKIPRHRFVDSALADRAYGDYHDM
ncbi:MAG: hypothetical protein ACE5H5_05630, partial [Nitrospinota bacterium]